MMPAVRSAMVFGTVLVSCLAGVADGASGQTAGPGSISATVVSAETGSPLAGATALVQTGSDTVPLASATTSANGRFSIRGLRPGRYRLTISFLGYSTLSRADVELTAATPALDLGELQLTLAPVELDAIEAQAERSPVQILTDRTVYTTKDMPASTGGTAVDLLRDVPELEVDINGNVKLRGNQAVAIHINGRPAPLRGDALNNFLQQMPADRIAKIEVMPNPTAKHDPEGSGGIVNLMLVENADLGLSGNLTARYGTRGSRGLNGRVAYQRGRVTLFGGVGLNGSDSEDDMFDVRQNLLASPVTVLEQEGRVGYDYLFGMFDLTTELKVAERTTAWFNATGYTNGSTNRSNVAYGLYDIDRAVLDSYDRVTTADGDGSTTDFATGFKHVFTQRHELTVDVRRNRFGNGNASVVEKLSLLDPGGPLSELRLTDNDSDNRGLTVKADYTRPLGEKGKIDAGVNLGRRDLDDSALLEVMAARGAPPDQRVYTTFGYEETYNSAYVTLGQTFDKLGVQVGLRGESAATRFTLPDSDESFDNDYRSLFPSLNLSYALAEGQTARLNYSKRVSRPYPGLLNPNVPAADPLNRTVGNPGLLPSYTHSISLDYSRIGRLGTVRIAPFYRRSVDGWENIKRVDEAGVSTVTWENSASSESMGATTTLSARPGGRFGGSINLGLYRYATDASNISAEFSRTSMRWSLGGNGTVRITESLNAQMGANYAPGRELPQGRTSAMFFSNLSLRQQLLNKRATLSFFITDPFDLYSYRFETRDRTHIQNSRTSRSFRSASISFTFNFGKPPQQVSRRDGASTVEETASIR